MKDQRRHLPKLETLDQRVVPSTVGITPPQAAVAAEHALVAHPVQAIRVHQAVEVHTHHHARVAHDAHAATDPATTTTTTTTTGGGTTTATPPPVSTATTAPSSPVITDPENGPLAKAGVDLLELFLAYEAQGGGTTFTVNGTTDLKINGTTVAIDARMASGSFSQYVSELTALGMKVQAQSTTYGIVEGYLPIGQLPAAAQNPQTLSLSAVYVTKNWAMTL
jgi:hypothetical protein